MRCRGAERGALLGTHHTPLLLFVRFIYNVPGMISCRGDVDFGVDFLSPHCELGPGWGLESKTRSCLGTDGGFGGSSDLVHNKKEGKKRAFGPRIYLEVTTQGHERPEVKAAPRQWR